MLNSVNWLLPLLVPCQLAWAVNPLMELELVSICEMGWRRGYKFIPHINFYWADKKVQIYRLPLISKKVIYKAV